jgi:hypothetical protein
MGDSRSLRLGIVGHRVFASKLAAEFAASCCAAILRSRMQQQRRLSAISALAEGADSAFAEAALELGLPLEVVRPFVGYADDFEAPHARRRYERLRAAAREEITLPFTGRSSAAYVAAMSWVVRRSDLLVAVWDGRWRGGTGGTADAVARAICQQRTWIHVDVTRFRVRSHAGAELEDLECLALSGESQ